MNRQHYRSALANLRRCARLEAKKEAIQVEIAELSADQFYFDEDAFNAALRDHEAEMESRPETGEIT